MERITGKEVKEAVDLLWEHKEGCFHKKMLRDDNNNLWCIVIGWGEGFDPNDKMKYQDGNFAICSKIAINDSSLQCDYGWDFTMPVIDEDTGDVYDTDSYIGEPENMKGWNKIAKELNDTFDDVIKECAFFEPDLTESA